MNKQNKTLTENITLFKENLTLISVRTVDKTYADIVQAKKVNKVVNTLRIVVNIKNDKIITNTVLDRKKLIYNSSDVQIN